MFYTHIIIIINIIVVAEYQVVLIHAIHAYTGSGVTAPLIIHISIRRRIAVTLTPWPLYPWESSQCPLTRSCVECYTINYSHSVDPHVLLLRFFVVTWTPLI